MYIRVSDRPNEKNIPVRSDRPHKNTVTVFPQRCYLSLRRKTMSLPNDPFMLMSYVNTMLRDKYASLDELCDDLDASRADITAKLSAAGFEYDEKLNKFC